MSSDVNISFATNDGALTVTRCASAARYICAPLIYLMPPTASASLMPGLESGYKTM